MDKRTLLALVLMALVLVVTPMIFPSPKRAATSLVDSTAHVTADTIKANAAAPTSTNTASNTQTPSPSPSVSAATSVPTATGARAVADSTVTATTPHAQYLLTTLGAAPAAVRIDSRYGGSLRPGRRDTAVVIAPARGPLLRYSLSGPNGTSAFDTIPFTVHQSGTTTTFASVSPAITVSYETKDGYRVAVRGTVAGMPPGTALGIELPRDLHSLEADTLDDQRHLAYGFKSPLHDVVSVPFSKLDPAETRADTGMFQWVSARDKYWLVALMQPVDEKKPAGVFHNVTMHGGEKLGRITRSASATTVQPLANGAFAFDMYVGPQSLEALQPLGNGLEGVNPYAGFLHAVVQPFATIVMRTLLWMKATLRVNYGWVLVLFGITIRLLLWPLNQKAMRTSMQMQRLQPELTEVQKKYKNDPDKQREALMKIYAAHGMSPLSPMLGCLPMLLPMPVLFALYFVFQNTIEFRGVQFLWLPDISLRDPYYIIPVVMGASMFLLSWIGMRSTPPNPQTKMMSYMMPVMFTVMFLNFASGLNLYYAVQNIAALPQQWILSRERAKAAGGGGTGSASGTLRKT